MESVPNSTQAEPLSTAHVVVSLEDRLHVENLHLKILNITHEVASLQRAVIAKSQQLEEVQKSIMALKVSLEQKYSINLTTHHIVPDSGAVIPAPMGDQFGELLRRAERV